MASLEEQEALAGEGLLGVTAMEGVLGSPVEGPLGPVEVQGPGVEDLLGALGGGEVLGAPDVEDILEVPGMGPLQQ